LGWRVSKIRKLDLGDLIQQSDPPHLRTFGSAVVVAVIITFWI
jgi:hypothetical protein